MYGSPETRHCLISAVDSVYLDLGGGNPRSGAVLEVLIHAFMASSFLSANGGPDAWHFIFSVYFAVVFVAVRFLFDKFVFRVSILSSIEFAGFILESKCCYCCSHCLRQNQNMVK